MTAQLLTLAQACRALSMSERKLRQLVAERRICVVREGRWLRFEPAALAAFVEDRRVPALRVVDRLPPVLLDEDLEEVARRHERG